MEPPAASLADRADLQRVATQRLLQLQRPLPRLRLGVVLDVNLHLRRQRQGDRLGHVEVTQDVQEDRTAAVRRRRGPQVQSGRPPLAQPPAQPHPPPPPLPPPPPPPTPPPP